MNSSVGIVAIGRNEGARLEACLESVVGRVGAVVYVDSGSSDGSVEMARGRGVEVVELDMSKPFTAARARNAGAARLQEVAPDVEFVQFVDGDCVVVDGWIDAGVEALRADADLAVVCGWRRERAPEASVYNLLCDVEWDRPPGATEACGGDAMMRVEYFRAVDGFNPGLIFVPAAAGARQAIGPACAGEAAAWGGRESRRAAPVSVGGVDAQGI